MPSSYQGSNTIPSYSAWQATHAYTAGNNVIPSPATGQYFQCSVTGTSGSSQPSWSGPTFPVPGQTFAADGSVTWVCMGSALASATAPIVDIPLDTDPALTAVVARGLKTLANFLSPLSLYAALINVANTWTATNTFSGSVQIHSLGVGEAADGTTGDISYTGTLHGAAAILGGSVQINSLGVGEAADGTTGDIRCTGTLTSGGSAEVLGSLVVAGEVTVGTQIDAINNVDTVGNFGVATTLANSGTEQVTGFTTSTSLASVAAPFDGMYRFDVYAKTSNSNTPTLSIGYEDPVGPSAYILVPNMVALGNDLWNYTVVVFCKAGYTLSVALVPNSQTCTNAFASVTALS